VTTDDPAAGCCGVTHGCVFAKALLARAAACKCAGRRQAGETAVIDCRSVAAHGDCEALMASLAGSARFALRLPPSGRPMLHVQALRLQCGGLAALRSHLEAPEADVQELVARARPWEGLPWPEIVRALAAWQPRRRGTPAR